MQEGEHWIPGKAWQVTGALPSPSTILDRLLSQQKKTTHQMQVMTQSLLCEIDLSLVLIFQPAVSELLCCHIDILMETEELASMQLLRAVQAGLAFFLLLIHLPGLLRGEEEGEAGEDDEEGQGHHPCPLIGISVVSGYCSSSYCVRQLISCSPFLPPFVTSLLPLPL